jgi:hypothetical protein
MGGSGSGNWYRFDSKTLAEHCLNIDVRHLNRKGSLAPGKRYYWKWQDGNNIVIETLPEAIELFYGISRNEQPREDVHTKVPLSWSSCNYGGKRPWFICPGKGCGRRVVKLYLAGNYFLCRHCHDLVYSSQRERKEFRLLNKAQKIYRRLGVNNCDDLLIACKPKGMHQSTYWKLVEEAQELELESLYAISRRLNNMYNFILQKNEDVDYGSATSKRG